MHNEVSAPGTVWIEYCNGQLDVYLDKDGDNKPRRPAVSTTVDLAGGVFSGSSREFFIGFTSGVYNAENHDVLSWEMQQGCNQFV
jgi:hypothetical protein